MKTFSPRVKKILFDLAIKEAKLNESTQILPEHIILALLNLKEGIGYFSIEKLGMKIDSFMNSLKEELSNFIINSSPKTVLEDIPKSRRYRVLLDLADIEASALHNNYIGTEHILLAAVRDEDSLITKFFNKNNINIMDLRFTATEFQKAEKSSFINLQSGRQVDNIVDSIFKNSLFRNIESNENNKVNAASPNFTSNGSKKSFLFEYSRDLTQNAFNKKNDSVIGRDKEIGRVIQILSRCTKNNPILIGEPGVGKTAVIEGLAQRIASEKVPENLLNKHILSLDLTSMVAGTKYRGEFEERMKKMMKELHENDNIILFIDELHTIIGAGSPEGTMDASNILKPALSRGEIQIIGATTTKEYTKYIEKDSALERRFQVVKVEEPSDSETEDILNGIKIKYEKYHNVIYNSDVVPAIVKLSRRYIPERVLPDKAIDILDEAGAAKKIKESEKPAEIKSLELNISHLIEEKKALVQKQDFETAALVRDKVNGLKQEIDSYNTLLRENEKSNKKHVTVNDIENIISEMTSIPIRQLTTSEYERLVHMEDELHDTIIGQNEAVSIISSAIRRAKAGISSHNHPIGSFIFLGPTGVGKTKLAKALAKYLFGSENALIRIDMSDYMEKHNSSRLVGAPPGYIGYEEGGILTERVRRNPYSVILLDEIEKAHPDIFNLLLQILEEGELCDNLGHVVNFRNTVIIMTSNAGARQITNEGKVGFGLADSVISYNEIKAGALNELKKLLSPELLNRIDDVIVFNTLSKKEVSKILDIQLKELEERLIERKLKIEITSGAREYLIEHGYNSAMGARPMNKIIRKEIEDPLAMEILSNFNRDYNKVLIEYSNNSIVIKLTKEAETIENQQFVKELKLVEKL